MNFFTQTQTTSFQISQYFFTGVIWVFLVFSSYLVLSRWWTSISNTLDNRGSNVVRSLGVVDCGIFFLEQLHKFPKSTSDRAYFDGVANIKDVFLWFVRNFYSSFGCFFFFLSLFVLMERFWNLALILTSVEVWR